MNRECDCGQLMGECECILKQIGKELLDIISKNHRSKIMSDECDKCGEHALDCDCINIMIVPPEGTTFKECIFCHNPFVYDGTSENCLWCEIKDEFCQKCKNELVACVCL